ncbi:MAG TPA: glycosyltransferase family 4 protein [Armatimonadota bacterium]|nr:glycosyltransferase family 4 protein [Armatimonadota bacterium]
MVDRLGAASAPPPAVRRAGLLVSGSLTRKPENTTAEPGSSVAGLGCARALLRYSAPAGVELFVPEENLGDIAADLSHLAMTGGIGAVAPILTPVSGLKAALNARPPIALHNIGGMDLASLSHARQMLGGPIFPITCMQYGFSYQKLLREMATNRLLSQTFPCDAVICASETARQATARILERLQGDLRSAAAPQPWNFQLSVIPHGVETEVFRPRDRQDLRSLLALPLDRTLILYVGRVDPSSKTDIFPLLIAFQKIVAKHGDSVALVLAGPIGQRVQNLQAIVKEMGLSRHVIHRDNIARSSIPLYYSAADIFVSLSDTMQENFGLTPLEAMSSGLPVVVSDWAGYRDTGVHGETGFKITSRWMECDQDIADMAPFHDWSSDHYCLAQSIAIDVESVAHHLDLLVSHPELRTKMGAAARELVLSQYTWERSARMFWELWTELSARAQTLPPIERGGQSLMRPQYFGDFFSFASECLDGAARVKLTDRGLRVCRGKERTLQMDDARNLIDAGLILTLLRFVRMTGSIGQMTSVDHLVSMMQKKHAASTAAARRHILWLLKYDLLRIDARQGPGAASGRVNGVG